VREVRGVDHGRFKEFLGRIAEGIKLPSYHKTDKNQQISNLEDEVNSFNDEVRTLINQFNDPEQVAEKFVELYKNP
ncbi:11880_t:CDS:2, partial [Gigaspora rosea]